MNEELIQNIISEEKITTVDLPKVNLKRLIEALILGSNEVVTAKDIRVVFDEVNKIASNATLQNKFDTISAEELNKIVDQLNKEYAEGSHPFAIQRIAGGFLFATKPDYSIWLGKLYNERARKKLSITAIETLAIIAYKQPISKTDIEFIRGVNCDYILKTLLEKNIVSIVGRAPTAGRPLLYGTTDDFLKQFGLNEISELPKPREIEEMMTEAEREMEKHILRDEQDEFSFEQKKIEPVEENSRAPHIPRKKSILQMTSEEIAELKKSRNYKLEEVPTEKDLNTKIKSDEQIEIEKIKVKKENVTEVAEKIETVVKEIETKEKVKQEKIILENIEPEQKGWNKWKTRITTALKKLFG